MDGEDVGFLHGLRIDALLRLDRRQCGEAVAVKRRGFEREFGRGLFHLAGKLLLDEAAAAGKEVGGLVHQLGIAGKIDLAGAGPRTAPDLIEQAGPGAAFKKTVGAGAHQEGALQRGDGAVDRAGGGERPEIPSRPRLRAAMFQDLRRPVIARDQNIGKRFVVAQLHVEARPQLLDQIGLEQQRLGFGRRRHDLDRRGRRDHAQDACRLRCGDPGVGRKPLADVLGLADIQHVVGRIEHAIDARARSGHGAPHARSQRGRTPAGRPVPPRRSRREPPAAAPRRLPRRRPWRDRCPKQPNFAPGPAAANPRVARPVRNRAAPAAGRVHPGFRSKSLSMGLNYALAPRIASVAAARQASGQPIRSSAPKAVP